MIHFHLKVIVFAQYNTVENEGKARWNIRVPDFNNNFRFYSIIYYILVYLCPSKDVKSDEPLSFLCHIYNRFYFQSCRCVYYWDSVYITSLSSKRQWSVSLLTYDRNHYFGLYFNAKIWFIIAVLLILTIPEFSV